VAWLYTKLSTQEQAQQVQFVLDFAGPRRRLCLKVLPSSRPSPPQMPMAACWKASPTKKPATGVGAPRSVQRLDASQPIECVPFSNFDNNTPSETWTNLITP
jgi:hypothetical protein